MLFRKFSIRIPSIGVKLKKKIKGFWTNWISTISVFDIFVPFKQQKINNPKDSLLVFTKRCLNGDHIPLTLLKKPLPGVDRDKEKKRLRSSRTHRVSRPDNRKHYLSLSVTPTVGSFINVWHYVVNGHSIIRLPMTVVT